MAKKSGINAATYPILGLGITYTNYGIDSVYGRLFSVYPNIVIPLITGRKLEWTLRIGDGIGYATRDYSRINPFDTINNAIGSKINDYFSFMMDLRYHINIHWDVQLGVNFSHYSDGSFHQPNLGVNLPGFHVGVKYWPESSAPTRIKRELKHLKNRWLFQYRITMGFNESSAPQGPIYPVYLGTAYMSKRWQLVKINSLQDLIIPIPTNCTLICEIMHLDHRVLKSGMLLKQPCLPAMNLCWGGSAWCCNLVTTHIKPMMCRRHTMKRLAVITTFVQRERGPVKEFFLCAFS